MGSYHGTSLRMDLNDDNQMGARADLVRDQTLSAMCHVGVALTPLDSDHDGPSREIGAPLSRRLVFPARMA
jgi:hypothetical protein